VVGAGQWWQCDHELYGDAVYWCHGADGDGCVGEPAGDVDDGGRFDEWDDLYLYGGGDQRGGDGFGFGCVQCGDPDGGADGAGGSGCPVGGGRCRFGDRQLVGSGRWWQCDYQLYGDAVCGDDGFVAGDGVGEPAGDHHNGVRLEQRHGLHVHGGGYERGGYRAGVACVECGDADCASDCSWCAGGSVGGGG
jgi:hypothetical protein